MSPSARLWALGAALFALAAAAFFQFFEKRSFELDVGYQGEAAQNRYLAAQRMLERMGTSVRSLELAELDRLPPVDATLIIPTERATLSDRRSSELLQWVRAGGHLIVVTWTLWDEADRRPDPLLDPLGFRQYGRLDAASGKEVVPGEIARAQVPGRDAPLEVVHDPRFRFEDAGSRALWASADANGTHLLQAREGAGLLTALTDDFFMTSLRIGDYDHAELVYRLARAGGRAGPVWIVTAERWPGPWQLVSERGWPMLIALALLVAAWVWMRVPRIGPMRADPSAERRSLMEHIEASGRFSWTHGDAGVLAGSVREALLDRVRLRHPTWLELAPAELHERLARISEVPRESIDRALAYGVEPRPERFAQNIATMEKIARAL